MEKGEPDFLYINRGGGRFAPVQRWDVGVFLDEEGRPLTGPPTDWGLSVMFRDLNGDGLPDLYVCNDFVRWPDRVWLNQEGKRFRAAPRYAFRCGSLSSMAVDVADINRDGLDDIFVADMLSPHREFRAWQRPDTLAGTVTAPIGDQLPTGGHATRFTSRAATAPSRRLPSSPESRRPTGLGASLFSTWTRRLGRPARRHGNNHDVQDVDAMAEIILSLVAGRRPRRG